jgi:asparagine synthase (glutamine-hydrolysing)
MCGIAGYVGKRELTPETIGRCLERMHHRGPDASAYRHFTRPDGDHVYLLSSRLDIIDLEERSNQPLAVGDSWISYNGELYNYLEVRDELARAGRSFVTASDTEVLLTALDEWGIAGLDRCEGMWAFAAYDERDGKLTLCRDRFGEKPLYLLEDDNGIYWGSEAKFIVELFGRPLRPDLDQLFRYLVNGYKALYKDERTFFQGLRELPPATAFQLRPRAANEQVRFWRPSSEQDEGLSYEDAVAQVRERLIRSVELRLRADVPLAFCMSGGVDSLSLISIAKTVLAYDVHGFTIVNDDARYDEQDMVEHAVRELGLRHTAIPVTTEGFLPKLRGLVRHHDAPVYTITYYAHWLLMDAIAGAGYRISVSGTAADELFSGYYDHHLAYLYEVRADRPRHARALAAWTEHVRPLVRNPYLGNPDLFVRDATERSYIYLDAEEFAGYLSNGFREPFTEATYTHSLLRNRMLNELFHEAVPVILHEDDLNAMYFSIENRSPYLDRDLFELSTRIPTRHLVQDGRAKAVLRDAMRGIVPDKIVDNRRKVGFNAPILSFLDTKDTETRAVLLEDSPIFEHVRRERIAALLERNFLPNSESKFLFNFLNSKFFLEEFGG